MKFIPLLKQVLSAVRDFLNFILHEDEQSNPKRTADRVDSIFDAYQEERAARTLAEAKAKALELELERTRRKAIEDVQEARGEVRLQIADFLEHNSQVRTGSVFYREESLEIIGFCSHWVRNALDVEWARARAEQIEREKVASYQRPTLVREDNP